MEYLGGFGAGAVVGVDGGSAQDSVRVAAGRREPRLRCSQDAEERGEGVPDIGEVVARVRVRYPPVLGRTA